MKQKKNVGVKAKKWITIENMYCKIPLNTPIMFSRSKGRIGYKIITK